MGPQIVITKYYKVVLYLVTLGLVAYGILAIVNPDVFASGFDRFTGQDWRQFHIDNKVVASYITLLWRLIGGFNLAAGLILTLVIWKWLQPGNRWAWTTLLIGNFIAYLSPMSLDLTVGSIEFFEVLEFLLFGVFVVTMLLVKKEYFAQGEMQEQLKEMPI